MKKTILTIIVITLITIESALAQTPQAFKYQAIARDNSGNILINQSVSFRISILQGSISGSSVYTETQTTTTNQFGLANLNIGNGTLVSGNFTTISWGNNTYFTKIEFDPTGGTSFTAMGTSQLLSVPYALYSKKAGYDGDSSSTNELQTLTKSGLNAMLSNGGGTISIADGDTTLWKQNGSNIFYNTGNISIGTNTNLPSTKLDINGNNSTSYIRILSGGTGALGGIQIGTDVTQGYLGIAAVASQFSNISTQNDFCLKSVIGDIILNAGNSTGAIRFSTGATDTEKMTITNSGNVGIGTNSPVAKLQLDGGIGSAVNQRHAQFGISGGVTGSPQLFLYSSSNTSGASYVIEGVSSGVGSGPLAINPNGTNVGIGTLIPKSLLHVSSGDVYLDDSTKGVIMKSPNGSCYRVTVSNTGTLVSTAITCP